MSEVIADGSIRRQADIPSFRFTAIRIFRREPFWRFVVNWGSRGRKGRQLDNQFEKFHVTFASLIRIRGVKRITNLLTKGTDL